MTQEMHKPGIEEWLKVADMVADRLTECVHILKSPPPQSAFLAEAARQHKSHEINEILHRLHPLTDKGQMPDEHMSDLHAHDEQTIDGLNVIFTDIAKLLPRLSGDMQTLLKSPWGGDAFPNGTSRKLFAGEGPSLGIGSGHAAQGQLPQAIASLIEREAMGDMRKIRKPIAQLAEEPAHDEPAPQRRRVGTASRVV